MEYRGTWSDALAARQHSGWICLHALRERVRELRPGMRTLEESFRLMSVLVAQAIPRDRRASVCGVILGTSIPARRACTHGESLE